MEEKAKETQKTVEAKTKGKFKAMISKLVAPLRNAKGFLF